jgi:hypothetical protein
MILPVSNWRHFWAGAALLVPWMSAPGAQAAGFECSRASSRQEHTIGAEYRAASTIPPQAARIANPVKLDRVGAAIGAFTDQSDTLHLALSPMHPSRGRVRLHPA